MACALFLLGLLMSAPAPAVGQQDTTRTAPAPPADTMAPPPDTALTPRERALRRLRALPTTPVQPTPTDTLADDTLAADTLADDTLPDDTLPPDSVRVEGVPAEGPEPGRQLPVIDSLVVPERGPARRRAPDDTVVAFAPDDGPDEVLTEADIRSRLQELEGYSVTEYSGGAAVFLADSNQLELTGESMVGQGQNSLATDSLLVYDGESGVVCGYGAPVLSGETDPVTSDQVCFDIQRRLGVAVGARTTFQQGATWFVRGADNRVYLLSGGERNALYGERTEFTSCELDHPHYTFEAHSLKMVEDEMMVARDVTLQFEDVPVFWLPWMVQSMKRGRRSGLLMPQFGVNDIVRNSDGYNRHLSNLGFYWAINDYVSAKGTFSWFSGNWTSVEGALTYRWLRQFLRGNLIARHYWRERADLPPSGELTLNTSNSWQPDERTRMQLNANYATDTDFVRRNSFDPRELNRKIVSSTSVSRSFDWGSMSLGADRSEQLSTGQVESKLPGLSLNISPITLYQIEDGPELTWNGSGGFTRQLRDVVDTLETQDRASVRANYNHGLSFGRLGLSQSINWDEEVLGGRPEVIRDADTLPALDEAVSQSLGWSTGLSYQQTLWPGTTVSPNLSMNGVEVRDERTQGDFVAEPLRFSTGANLNTSIYGFWPGFAGFSRVRHKIAPTLRWSYSPLPDVTPRQEEVFGAQNLRERNTLTLSFNQTFEAKVREEEAADTAAPGTDQGAALGTAEGAAAVGGERTDGEPRRLAQAEKVMLLALDTRTNFEYDFVAAEQDGRGFQTENISNSIRSDLLRGLQVSTEHSLFEVGEAPGPGTLAPRTFDPFLTRLTASFSIDHEFWLFRYLGLTSSAREPPGPGQDGPRETEDAQGVANTEDPAVGAESDPDASGGLGSMVPGRGSEDQGPRDGVGGWSASLNYSLQRARSGLADGRESQLLSGNFSFQPTEKWNVRWSTAYSFTDREFANHVLTLSRDLHRWQANFDFVKAQNGNFRMSFRVQLRDNPDLKFDYDQQTDPSRRGQQ